MLPSRKWGVVLAIGLLMGVTLGIRAIADTEIAWEKVPDAARAMLNKIALGQTMGRIIIDKEDDVDTYDAEWQVDGKMHSGMVTSSGALMELQQEVPEAQVPKAVKAAIIQKFGKEVHAEYTIVTSISWDVDVTVRNKTQFISLNPTGSVVPEDSPTAVRNGNAPDSAPKP